MYEYRSKDHDAVLQTIALTSRNEFREILQAGENIFLEMFKRTFVHSKIMTVEELVRYFVYGLTESREKKSIHSLTSLMNLKNIERSNYKILIANIWNNFYRRETNLSDSFEHLPKRLYKQGGTFVYDPVVSNMFSPSSEVVSFVSYDSNDDCVIVKISSIHKKFTTSYFERNYADLTDFLNHFPYDYDHYVDLRKQREDSEKVKEDSNENSSKIIIGDRVADKSGQIFTVLNVVDEKVSLKKYFSNVPVFKKVSGLIKIKKFPLIKNHHDEIFDGKIFKVEINNQVCHRRVLVKFTDYVMLDDGSLYFDHILRDVVHEETEPKYVEVPKRDMKTGLMSAFWKRSASQEWLRNNMS